MRAQKHCLNLIAIFVIANSLYAQASRTGTTLLGPIHAASFTKIGVDNYAGGGAVIATSNNPAFAVTNPAAYFSQNGAFYVEVGKSPAAILLDNLAFDNHWRIPAFAAVTLPKSNGSYVIGYYKYYSNHMTLGPISITAPEQPEGTGEFYSATFSSDVHTFFASASHGLSGKLKAGITVGMNYLRLRGKTLIVSGRGDGLGFQAIVGGLFSATPQLNLATVFRYGTAIYFPMEKLKEIWVNLPIDFIKLFSERELRLLHDLIETITLCQSCKELTLS